MPCRPSSPWLLPQTRSPGLSRVTSGPTASTTPARSQPDDERLGQFHRHGSRADVGVDRIDGHRLHPNKDLIAGRLGLRQVAVNDAVRGAGLLDVGGFHDVSPLKRDWDRGAARNTPKVTPYPPRRQASVGASARLSEAGFWSFVAPTLTVPASAGLRALGRCPTIDYRLPTYPAHSVCRFFRRHTECAGYYSGNLLFRSALGGQSNTATDRRGCLSRFLGAARLRQPWHTWDYFPAGQRRPAGQAFAAPDSESQATGVCCRLPPRGRGRRSRGGDPKPRPAGKASRASRVPSTRRR